MKFEKIQAKIDQFELKTSIGPRLGRRLYDFILGEGPQRCLELGIGHGSSACYVAGALDELGAGSLTAVDLEPARRWQIPPIEELLDATGLQERVTVVREATSYTWFLRRKIEENSRPDGCDAAYDFCFIDGAKHWTTDGLAFFLVDKLLADGGWILFDDLGYTFRSVHSLGNTTTDFINTLEMSDEELDTPHIDSVFRLLVMQHPEYGEFRVDDQWWGWAHKIRTTNRRLVIDESYTLGTQLLRVVQKTKRRLQGLLGSSNQPHSSARSAADGE